jgi:UDP-N-acetylmuramyl pentapeptide phosphotransferase/UDP-N-acetylglucosamine-1-phosphate transferase
VDADRGHCLNCGALLHSFLALALIAFVLLGLIGDLVDLLSAPATVLQQIAIIWVPVYLLLMQRRVYAQGFGITFVKFGVIGIVYSVVVSVAVLAAVLITRVTA